MRAQRPLASLGAIFCERREADGRTTGGEMDGAELRRFGCQGELDGANVEAFDVNGRWRRGEGGTRLKMRSGGGMLPLMLLPLPLLLQWRCPLAGDSKAPRQRPCTCTCVQ